MRNCPGCDAPMQAQSFARKPLGTVELDLCFACHAIWFDQYESAQLTPGAVIELFRAIHEHGAEGERPSRERMQCPMCRKTLAHTFDLQRTQRIVYDRCPDGHGRFTTFFQFLREKEFVREVSTAELARLRATVAQVRCSSCGGAIDLARDAKCAYCGAAISVLDPQAVESALASLAQAERQRVTAQPTAVMDALLAGQRMERRLAATDAPASGSFALLGAVDLVGEALSMLLSH